MKVLIYNNGKILPSVDIPTDKKENMKDDDNVNIF